MELATDGSLPVKDDSVCPEQESVLSASVSESELVCSFLETDVKESGYEGPEVEMVEMDLIQDLVGLLIAQIHLERRSSSTSRLRMQLLFS